MEKPTLTFWYSDTLDIEKILDLGFFIDAIDLTDYKQCTVDEITEMLENEISKEYNLSRELFGFKIEEPEPDEGNIHDIQEEG